MKIGIISDIHGNIDALEIVLKKLEDNKVEKIICLGDLIRWSCEVKRSCRKDYGIRQKVHMCKRK